MDWEQAGVISVVFDAVTCCCFKSGKMIPSKL